MSTRPQDPAWKKRWTYDRHRGIKRLVPAAPVAGHCWDLENAGMSRRAIAEAAGVSPTAISNLMNQRNPTMQRATAAKVLAVRPVHILTRGRDLGFVPAIGARRRITALYAIGHTAATIASALDVKPHDVRNILNHPGRWITRANHDLMVTAFEQLWDQPGPSAHNRARAARYGWAPPMAWDDDTIDNPLAEPELGETAPNRAGRPLEHVLEDIEWLLTEVDNTLTADQVAHRLGYSDRSGIQQACLRGNRDDLLERLSINAQNAGHAVTRRTA